METKETTKVEEQKYNKPAIIGLVLSIISVFGLGLAGIAGFILGIVALVQIKHTHEKGRGLAIAAIIRYCTAISRSRILTNLWLYQKKCKLVS